MVFVFLYGDKMVYVLVKKNSACSLLLYAHSSPEKNMFK